MVEMAEQDSVKPRSQDMLESQMDAEQGSMEPQMDADGRGYQGINALTEKIIGAAMRVSTVLGPGFLEKPYENALAHELRKLGLKVDQQKPTRIMYDDVVVGEYLLDLLVEEVVVLELKACRGIDPAHVAQTINYLKATHHHLGLILNFGNPKLQIKRLVHQL